MQSKSIASQKIMTSHQQLWQTFFPQFTACPDSSVKSLMASAILVEVPAGEKVFYPGKRCEHYLLLVQGSVKAYLLSASGREVLLYHVHSGDSCILTTSCLLGNNHYPAEGICEGSVKAFAIPEPAFHRCMEYSNFFRDFVFCNFSARLTNVIGRMDTVLFVGIDQRLANILLEENSENISKTHQELAKELGTAREVVSRNLKRFEKYGWVKLNRGQLTIINPDALTALAESD